MSKSKLTRWARAVRTRLANLAAGRRKRTAILEIKDGHAVKGRMRTEYIDFGVRSALGLEYSGKVRISRSRTGPWEATEDSFGYGRYVGLSFNGEYYDFVCRKGFRKFTGMSIEIGDRFAVEVLETDVTPVPAPAHEDPALFVAPEPALVDAL